MVLNNLFREIRLVNEMNRGSRYKREHIGRLCVALVRDSDPRYYRSTTDLLAITKPAIHLTTFVVD